MVNKVDLDEINLDFIPDVIKIINTIPQGKKFLKNFPENEIILNKSIMICDISRISREYPDFLPFTKEELASNPQLSLCSITIIAKNL
jgi:hypothetical protein